jgi:hypothetical protein
MISTSTLVIRPGGEIIIEDNYIYHTYVEIYLGSLTRILGLLRYGRPLPSFRKRLTRTERQLYEKTGRTSLL